METIGLVDFGDYFISARIPTPGSKSVPVADSPLDSALTSRDSPETWPSTCPRTPSRLFTIDDRQRRSQTESVFVGQSANSGACGLTRGYVGCATWVLLRHRLKVVVRPIWQVFCRIERHAARVPANTPSGSVRRRGRSMFWNTGTNPVLRHPGCSAAHRSARCTISWMAHLFATHTTRIHVEIGL